jgi:uncharacterized delta-60 repeat protein
MGRDFRTQAAAHLLAWRNSVEPRRMKMSKSALSTLAGLVFLVLSVGVHSAHAAAGALDTTFGSKGTTVVSVANTDSILNSMLALSNDNILVFAGGAALVEFSSSGALDISFGSKGVATLSTPITGSLAVQPNGQIVVGGIITPSGGGADLGVERLNSNGTIDTSFGSGGVAVVSLENRAPNVGNSVLIYPASAADSGDILVCTTLINVGRGQPYQTALARFTPSGALDTTFGTQGLSIQTGVYGCTALALLSTGDILVVNTSAVAQFTSGGSAESTVTGGTIVATSQSSTTFEASIFDPSGDFLLGGELFVGEESRGHNSSGQVQRFSQTGTQVADATFHFVGTGGSGIEALVQAVAAQGNFVVAAGEQITFAQSGDTTVNGLARLEVQANGSLALDPTFGNGGTVANNLPPSLGVVFQSTGKIVTAGFASNGNLTLARYLAE